MIKQFTSLVFKFNIFYFVNYTAQVIIIKLNLVYNLIQGSNHNIDKLIYVNR